jgi:hypothetical protein
LTVSLRHASIVRDRGSDQEHMALRRTSSSPSIAATKRKKLLRFHIRFSKKWS